MSASEFHEVSFWRKPIRELGLTIAGTPLEPILRDFEGELRAAGLRLRPHFYLSTEWGVPFGTVAVAIPFYLARTDLARLHAEHHGHIEGVDRDDVLRYLRHEMGHVVNYAYRLYETEDWARVFGAFSQPYLEEYRPEPFSPRFVRHLPGWYAQKHPDEDWAETFAVWLTPHCAWRTEYADWPVVAAKLEYCDRTMRDLAEREPLTTATEPDDDVAEIESSLEDFYRLPLEEGDALSGLDGVLRTLVEGRGKGEARVPAAGLIRSLETTLLAAVYQWTGHFPERTRRLTRRLADRADRLGLVYPKGEEIRLTVDLTALVTALAVNHVHRGAYFL